MLEIFLFLLGLFGGTITGLIPGLHINLVVSWFLSVGLSSPSVVYFLVPLAITHTFIDFIPSIIFGVPEASTIQSVLPGHRLLLRGKGLRAIRLTMYGSLFSSVFSLALIFLFIKFLKTFRTTMFELVIIFLFSILGMMVFQERKKLLAFSFILCAGIFGYFSLSYYDAILPLITGFFGLSNLLFSLRIREIPEQKQATRPIKLKKVFLNSFLSSVFSPMAAIFPAASSSQVAFIAEKFFRFTNEAYLVFVGGINTSTIIFSFATLFFLGKARTGIAAFFRETFPLDKLLFAKLLVLIFISIFFAFLVASVVSRFSVVFINKINYKTVSVFIFLFVSLFVFFLYSLSGLAILYVSTFLGFVAIKLGFRRGINMSCLLIPTLIHYLKILLPFF